MSTFEQARQDSEMTEINARQTAISWRIEKMENRLIELDRITKAEIRYYERLRIGCIVVTSFSLGITVALWIWG